MLGILTYLRKDAPTSNKISKLRKSIRDRLGMPTVSGFGPRYLHSTGQLYKGGPDQAVYLFITSAPKKDIEIPGKSYTFGVLERAQAVGDIQALVETGRPAYRIELDSPDRLRDFLEVFYQVIERKSNN
jgi:transaldolase/glucose-6-phosphate isomerase